MSTRFNAYIGPASRSSAKVGSDEIATFKLLLLLRKTLYDVGQIHMCTRISSSHSRNVRLLSACPKCEADELECWYQVK